MPFRSKAQRRACYAKHDPDWDCGEWERHTPKGQLPERVRKHFKEFIQHRDPQMFLELTKEEKGL